MPWPRLSPRGWSVLHHKARDQSSMHADIDAVALSVIESLTKLLSGPLERFRSTESLQVELKSTLLTQAIHRALQGRSHGHAALSEQRNVVGLIVEDRLQKAAVIARDSRKLLNSSRI